MYCYRHRVLFLMAEILFQSENIRLVIICSLSYPGRRGIKTTCAISVYHH